MEHADGAGDPAPAGPAILGRDATAADMPAARTICAHHVLHGLATFEEVPPTTEELSARRAALVKAGRPYLVADSAGAVVGYSYAGAYRPRPAYRHPVEDSVYMAPGHHGRGIGRALLAALIERCDAGPWRQMIAVIGDSGNAASIALHEAFGFRTVGSLRALGFKPGRWVDTVLMQRKPGAASRTLPFPGAEDGGR